MNTHIIDFLRNISDENVIAAKESIHSALAQKVSDSLSSREAEIKNTLYNKINKEE